MTEKKNAWRDPLRFAMHARPGKTGTAVLFAALIAAFYLIAAKLCSGMDGVAVIAACGTLGAALAAQIARYCGWPPLNKANFYGFMLAIAGACLVQGVALLIGKRLE